MKIEELFPWLNKGDDTINSDEGQGPTFASILSRRTMLKDAAASIPLMVIGTEAAATIAQGQTTTSNLTFQPVSLLRIQQGQRPLDFVNVPANYGVGLVIAWGSPITQDAPDFSLERQTAASQAGQFGYNNDWIGYYPLPEPTSTNNSLGLLGINHEYVNPELMFPGYDANAPTKDQVDVMLAAHGMSVVEVQRNPQTWEYVRFSRYNRRITADTPMEITGPAAGADLMKTSADATGTRVNGTLNNCAGGRTPWGTILTAEENFHQYFANLNGAPDGPVKDIHRRYGLPTGASDLKWERFYDRFDLAKEPNESFRFGWMVEVDPYDPAYVPKKRTALGRFRHEGATFMENSDGRLAFYTGDDQVFEYVYKFVTSRPWDRNNRAANFTLLDEGTLYVARFNADGSGQWLPLVQGQGPLTEANGFRTQADVLINTRRAADLLNATKMDRPEDIEGTPVNGRIYIALTNNTSRGLANQPATDAANPRTPNRTGHIIEFTETNNNYAGTTFRWEIFILCGNPADPATRTYFAGIDPSRVSAIGAPDNVNFDSAGNLWIATDGQPSAISGNDGLFAVATQGPERGLVKHFMSVPAGAETCGGEFTPDSQNLFIAVQHPGEGAALGAATPVSNWPFGTQPPRPAIIAITKRQGDPVIGTR